MTYDPITDGFPKPFINTEFGSNEWHFDWDAKDITTQSHAAAFDRNMRAHVAVAQGFLQHAAFFNHQKKEFEKFSMFADVEGDDWDNPHEPLDTRAWPASRDRNHACKPIADSPWHIAPTVRPCLGHWEIAKHWLTNWCMSVALTPPRSNRCQEAAQLQTKCCSTLSTSAIRNKLLKQK
ncbi:MAG: hypothetical protein HC898_09330 [Phycisphaerales bacterium]|nr:hypothetical protein [Phycisphaerales bacterium]